MSVERFMIKRGDILSILPAVAAPALGAFGGKALGAKFPSAIGENVGALIGGITGGVTGSLLKERAEKAEEAKAAIPPGAPYALDTTSADIPPWAIQGAQLLQPAMKQANHLGPIVGGDLAGLVWPVGAGIHAKRPAGDILRDVAGQGLGTLGGGLAGHLAGGLIDKYTGHTTHNPLMVPGVGISLSDLLAGLGATIGNVRGSELVRR